MKILYILNKSVLTGPNIVALTNIEHIHDQGYDVSICFLNNGDDLNNIFPFLKEIEVFYLNLKSLGFISGLKNLNYYINSIKPTIIHSHCFLPDIYNIFNKFFCGPIKNKRVTTIHNIPKEDYRLRYGRIKGSLLLYFHKALFPFFDNCICISKTVQKSIGIKKTSVIYNPVRDVFFNSTKDDVECLTIVYCGHFSQLKNPITLIQLLADSKVNFQFLGIGDGPLLYQCRQLVKKDPRFTFVGRVNHVHKFYEKANCLIHISQTEGFCLSVAEALASNMYVITNELPVFLELKQALSSEGFYMLNDINNYNLEMVLNSINRKIEAGERCNSGASNRVKALLSPTFITQQHIVLYQKLTVEK